MNSKTPRSRNDDIVQLKDRLGLEDMPYQDLTRVIELGRICRRWPLLGETAGQPGVAQGDLRQRYCSDIEDMQP